MDSVSQIALGAACGVAAMRGRTAVWKAALWGGLFGTLPDLDAFIDHGDPVSNMTLHRGNSHSVFILSAVSPLLAALPWLAHGRERYARWWLAAWLALVTHPLLDTMTVYGTQLLRPFTEHPFGVGSVFIIDPLYTVPLIVGVVAALRGRGSARGLRWNSAGLVVSTAYLAWSFIAQQVVENLAQASLRQRGVPVDRMLVTPAPFNTLLWRIVAMQPDGNYREGFYSLLDGTRDVRFDAFQGDRDLYRAVDHVPAARRMAWFTHGFFKMDRVGDHAAISDLRMGQEPVYTFTFTVAQKREGGWQPLPPTLEMRRMEWRRGLQWLFPRIAGQPVPPPR